MNIKDLHLLIIQIRPDVAMCDHEYELVKKFSGLSDENFYRHQILNEPIDPLALNGKDALVICGSGDFLISDGDIPEVIVMLESLARAARSRGIPTVGICFGGQILAKAFGGQIIKDAERQENGTYDVTLTKDAKFDPIMSELPEIFSAQLGHKDHIDVLPDGAVNLASTPLSKNQAFIFPGEPIYGFTFHPEMDKKSTIERLKYYSKIYDLSEEKLQEISKKTFDTPDATTILRHFIEKVVLGGQRYGVGH